MDAKPRNLLLIGIDQAIPYLLKKFMNENILPNISRLVENGVLAEAYPCPPCDTPTNWTTIATGATTAVHGATSFYLHIPSEPLDLGLQFRSRTQLSRYCTAEYLWDVGDRHGLIPFVINYPGGWPSNFRKGAMSLYIWPIPESLPRIVSPPTIHTFTTDSINPSFSISRAEELSEKSENSSPHLQIGIQIKYKGIEKPSTLNIFILDSEGKGYDSLRLPLGPNKGWQILKNDDWSDWIPLNVITIHGTLPCLLKVKILELIRDGSRLKLQRTGIYNTIGWTQPESFGEQLVRNVMTFEIPKEQKVEYMISGKVEPFLSYAKRESQTIARAIIYAKENLSWHVCFFHIHFLDSINHKFLASLYKDSPIYTEKKAKKAAKNIETAYKIVDELVETLMKTCVDKDTLVVLVSDHGAIPAWKIANIPFTLMRAGLLNYKWNSTQKKFIIDWDKTSAFPYLEPTYIWINLKGREPHGIVSQAKYELVRDEVIKALYDLKDPETGDSIIQLALRREDADYFGQNGERIGDVVYFLNPPYQIFDGRLEQLNAAERTRNLLDKPKAYNAKRCFGAHVYYLPTTKLGDYTISAPLIMTGPSVKKGIELKETVDLIDVAPTLSHLLQIPKPKNSQGRILYEVIN